MWRDRPLRARPRPRLLVLDRSGDVEFTAGGAGTSPPPGPPPAVATSPGTRMSPPALGPVTVAASPVVPGRRLPRADGPSGTHRERARLEEVRSRYGPSSCRRARRRRRVVWTVRLRRRAARPDDLTPRKERDAAGDDGDRSGCEVGCCQIPGMTSARVPKSSTDRRYDQRGALRERARIGAGRADVIGGGRQCRRGEEAGEDYGGGRAVWRRHGG
jgi:hypothetical protein